MSTERNAVAAVGPRRFFAAVLFVLASNSAMAQTTFGTGTEVVIPTAANISVYHTQVFVRNPNPTPISVNVRYYQSINGTPPAGLRACTPLSLQANQSSSFDLGAACGLTGANDDFGMIILEDAVGTNPLFAYSRTQTPSGIGFSVEGFPIENFTGASADVLGLQKLSTAPNYRSNCFVGALAQPVNWQMQLVQSGTETVLATTGGSLQPYQATRILDVFASLGLAGDFANVRATFTTSDNPAPPFIRFCTLETSSNGSADFRIAKSNIGSVADAFVQNGNAFGTTARLGTTENQPLELFVNNQRAMRYEPNATTPNIVGGHASNLVASGSGGQTVAGGGGAGSNCFNPTTGQNSRICANIAGADYATIGGGQANVASGFGTVGGGRSNAAGSFGTVAGGFGNTTTNDEATVGGGSFNVASGSSATVPGGSSNVASGAASVALGHEAVAGHDNTFVFNGWSTVGNAGSFRPNSVEFMANHGLAVEYGAPRADGGGGGTSWVCICDIFAGEAISTNTGAHLSTGGAWVNNSDRARKTAFEAIDPRMILDKVAALPIASWQYLDEGPAIRHIGPTAQDFRSLFGLGSSQTSIGTIDADGVALAAIQGLHRLVQEKAARIEALEEKLHTQQEQLTNLHEMLESMQVKLGRDTGRRE